jgi:hypothetical protein
VFELLKSLNRTLNHVHRATYPLALLPTLIA